MSEIINSNHSADPSVARADLLAALDRYVHALISGDEHAARLAPRFRETQNAVETRPGDGLWSSATRVAEAIRYADAAEMQAGLYGIIDEVRGPTVAGLRIRIDDASRVTEAEWILARVGMTFFNPYGLRANPPRRRMPDGVPASSRTEALRVAESYFEGVAASNASVVLAHADAYRVENGSLNVGPLPGRPPYSDDRPAGDGVTTALVPGRAELTHGFDDLHHITDDVVDRRFFYDETAGMVWSHGVFSRVPGATNRLTGAPVPWLDFFELFQIDGGRISAVHSTMSYLPASITGPGWSTA